MIHPLLRLLSYMRPHKKDALLACLYSLLNKIFDIAPEILIGVAVDTVVREQHSWLALMGMVSVHRQLLFLGGLTLVIWGFESLFQYLFSIKWRNLAQAVQHSLRLEAYEHVQNFDMGTFEGQKTGNLLSILNDDINQLERFLENGVNTIMQIIFSSLLVGAVFFFLAPTLAWLAIIPVPLIVYGAFYFQDKLSAPFLEVRTKAGAISSRIANNIIGIFTIKSFVAESFELKQVAEDSCAYQEANRRAIKLSSMVTPVIRIAVLIGFVATLVYGGFLTIEGQIVVGVYSMLVFLTQRLLWPLTELAEVTVNYQRTMAATTRIFDLLAIPIRIPREGKVLVPDAVRGAIAIDRLSFAYEPGHPVLNDISLNIPAGSTVAFVGTTGSGKTTLIKLLLRFYAPQKGKILLDGQDIAQIALKDLRRHVGIVSQDVFLFDGTVAENIAYAFPDCPRDKIVEAATLAEAHEFIDRLPQGYDTLVGERGQKLSGGQKQRLAIARAVIRQPPILIFDEATSAVDNETEIAIQKSLKHITVGRTTMIIAHRLSTIRDAQNIFVMKHGQIIEQGTHDQLLKHDNVYATLWKLQTGQRGIHEELLRDSIS
jgi:ATP-binding cassette, subfamily B, bacterial